MGVEDELSTLRIGVAILKQVNEPLHEVGVQTGVEVIHEDGHSATQSVQHRPDHADPCQRSLGFMLRIDRCGPFKPHVVQAYEVTDEQSVVWRLRATLFKSVHDPERPPHPLGKLRLKVAVESLYIGDAEIGRSDKGEDSFTCLGIPREIGGPGDALRAIAGVHQEETGAEPGEQRPEQRDDPKTIPGCVVCRRAGDREEERVPSDQTCELGT